jgi:uncharacterized protein
MDSREWNYFERTFFRANFFERTSDSIASREALYRGSPLPASGARYNELDMIAKDLLDMLVCPVCKTPVVLNDNGMNLKCGQCHRLYPIKDDIPVMLVDAAKIERP